MSDSAAAATARPHHEIDECRYCGKTLAEHFDDDRFTGGDFPPPPPPPGMACGQRKSAFVARVVQETAPPAPLPALEPYPILRFFECDHLPQNLRDVAGPFAQLARVLAGGLPPGPEVAAGLRKLLEAKDCFVRAAL
jgi:hypothetical protein